MEVWLHLRELRSHLLGVDESVGEHGVDVGEIAGVTALDLRECLGAEIVVMNGHASDPRNDRTPELPTRWDRDELIRRRKFDVELETLLELRDCAKHLVGLRAHDEIDVNSRCTPTYKDSARAANEKYIDVARRRPCECHEKGINALAVCYLAQAAAR